MLAQLQSNIPDTKSGSMGASQSISPAPHLLELYLELKRLSEPPRWRIGNLVVGFAIVDVCLVVYIVVKCLQYSHYQSPVYLFKRNSSIPPIQQSMPPIQQNSSPIIQKSIPLIQHHISPIIQQSMSPIQQNISGIIQRSISPIQRVPPEILRDIFRQVLVLHLKPDSNSLSRYKALISLGQICTTWRQICIEYPELWRHISIRFHKKTRDRVLNLAKICLERARAVPLILDMHTKEETNANHLYIIMNALLPYFPRCKRLYMFLVAEFIPSLSTVHHSMRFLEHLELTLTSDLAMVRNSDFEQGRGHIWPSALTAFEDAPHLKSVKLLSVSFIEHDVLQKLNLPWSQLTHLEIRNYFFNPKNISLFLQCINLEQCTLGLLCCNGVSEVDSPRVVLPRLQELHLVHKGFSFFAVDDFLDILNLPALRTISLEGTHSYTFLINELLVMQAYSDFALTSLSITRFSFPLQASGLKALFRTIPSLVSLSLINCACSARIFEALAYAESDPLLPCLQEVTIKEDGKYEDPIFSPLARTKYIMDIVESRWWTDTLLPKRPIARLRKMHAEVMGRPLDLSERDKIARYQEEGLCCIIVAFD